MPAPVKHIVKKVTPESIYQVVDERTSELKEDIHFRQFPYRPDTYSS
jgi:hypothetical protein